MTLTPNHVHLWAHGPSHHFHRALGIYLRQNHGDRAWSGKLTPRQRRRLWKKYPDEMSRRRYELRAAEYKGWT